MLGHLVPCGGGQAMALAKSRLLLGRKETTSEGQLMKNDVELQLIDGWWHVRRIELGRQLAVNGRGCDSARLKPNDVLTIGGKFFRITYQAPEPVSARPVAETSRSISAASGASRPSTISPVPPAAAIANATPVPAAPAASRVSATKPAERTTAAETGSFSPPIAHRDSTTIPGDGAVNSRAPVKSGPGTAHAALGILLPCGGGVPIPLRKPKIIIGRSLSCDVIVPNPNVSARHCSLDLIQGYWQMADLESTNGTAVDGMKYRQKWVLPGSVLGLPGKRYRFDYQPKGQPPSLADDDVIVMPNRSLTELAGIVSKLIETLPVDEEIRTRWKLE